MMRRLILFEQQREDPEAAEVAAEALDRAPINSLSNNPIHPTKRLVNVETEDPAEEDVAKVAAEALIRLPTKLPMILCASGARSATNPKTAGPNTQRRLLI